MGSLQDAINTAQQYQKPMLQPQGIQPPPFNFQMPPVQQKQQGPNPLGAATQQLGTKLLGNYMNRPKATAEPEPQDAMSLMTAGTIGAPVAAMATGGPWDQYLGMPVEVGEQGPEDVVGDDGQQQVVGQNGPQTVVPQQAATVIPAQQTAQLPPLDTSATRPRLATPIAAGITDDTSASRPRIANMPQFLRNKISDESMGVTGGPVWGSGQTNVDADGNVIKAPGKLHAALANARNAAIVAQSQSPDWRRTLAAAVTGLASGAADPKDAQLADQRMTANRDQGTLNQLDQNTQAALNDQMRQAQIYSTVNNAGINRQKADILQQRADTADKAVNNRLNIENAKRQLGYDTLDQRGKERLAQRISQQYNRLPEFDPDDPKNAEMVAAMESAGVPVTPKARGLQLQAVQDKDSGQWSVIGMNKGSGSGSVNPVTTQTGDQFKTTAPHQITLQDIQARRQAAMGLYTDKAKAKAAGNEAVAKSFDDAANSYEQLATDADNSGNSKGARAIRQKAIAARQRAQGIRAGKVDVDSILSGAQQ